MGNIKEKPFDDDLYQSDILYEDNVVHGLWNMAKEYNKTYKSFDSYTYEERKEMAKDFLEACQKSLNSNNSR